MRQREATDGQETRTWTAQYQPADSFRGHFEFGLKYERLGFEFFSRLFGRVDPEEVASWVRDEPTGSYARRADERSDGARATAEAAANRPR